MNDNEYLAHYGVLGMKWGVRKDRRSAQLHPERTVSEINRLSAERTLYAKRAKTASSRSEQYAKKAQAEPRPLRKAAYKYESYREGKASKYFDSDAKRLTEDISNIKGYLTDAGMQLKSSRKTAELPIYMDGQPIGSMKVRATQYKLENYSTPSKAETSILKNNPVVAKWNTLPPEKKARYVNLAVNTGVTLVGAAVGAGTTSALIAAGVSNPVLRAAGSNAVATAVKYVGNETLVDTAANFALGLPVGPAADAGGKLARKAVAKGGEHARR